MTSWKRWMMVVVAGGLLISCARAGIFDHPLMGKKAPDVTVFSMQGREVSLGSAVQGKKAILFFWATWCPHCRSQLARLKAAQSGLKDAGVALVLVDIAEPKRDVQRFLAQKGFDFEVLLDREGEAAEEYRISGVPSFVFVAADGKVRDVLHELPGDYLEILK